MPDALGNTNVVLVWGWMRWSSQALGTRTLLGFGHGCAGHRMLLEQERYYGLGMGALVIGCSWNTNIFMVWARMLWSSDALGTRTLLYVYIYTYMFIGFGHGYTGDRTSWEQAGYCGLGMDALVIGCPSVLSGEGGKPRKKTQKRAEIAKRSEHTPLTSKAKVLFRRSPVQSMYFGISQEFLGQLQEGSYHVRTL